MPEGLDQLGATGNAGTDKVDRSIAHKPGCIDCLGKPDFGSPVDDPDRGFMGKLSDKFFCYLRHLAR